MTDDIPSEQTPRNFMAVMPQAGVTQVIVMQSDGSYVQRLISELDLHFARYPESYSQLIGDEIEAAFRKVRDGKAMRVTINSGKIE